MAYQPIQMPQTSGAGIGLEALTNSLQASARARQQRDELALQNLKYQAAQKQQGTENERQRHVDFQAALLKADGLAKAGDVEGARALLAPFADSPNEGQIQTRPMTAPDEWAPRLNQTELGGLDQVPLMSNGPPQDEPPPVAPGAPLEPPPQPQGFPAMPGQPAPAPATAPGAAAPAAPPNPLVAAAQSDQAKKAQLAKFFSGKFNGQQLTFDPEADRNDQLARADQAFGQASSEEGDTGGLVRELYPQMRAAALASGQPLDAQEALKYIQSEVKTRRLESAEKDRNDRFDQRQEQQLALERMREQARTDLETQQQGGGKYSHRGGAGSGPDGEGYDWKVEKGNTAAINTFNARTTKWFKQSGFEALQHAKDEAERARKSLQTGNPAGAAHALEKLVSISRNGMATTPALKLFQDHLAGFIGTAEGAMAGLQDGSLGPEKTRNLDGALGTITQSIASQMGRIHQEYVAGNYTPAMANLKGNVEDREEELMGAAGFHPRYDPNALMIVPGSGRHAMHTGRGGGGEEPKGPTGQAPPDAAKVAAAQKRLADPNETPERKARARQFLETGK